MSRVIDGTQIKCKSSDNRETTPLRNLSCPETISLPNIFEYGMSEKENDENFNGKLNFDATGINYVILIVK